MIKGKSLGVERDLCPMKTAKLIKIKMDFHLTDKNRRCSELIYEILNLIREAVLSLKKKYIYE